MKETWASGAIELLNHADDHIENETAFDSRIAFISIDNSIEIIIRTYLSLPEKKSGVRFTKKDIDDIGNSFPKMVELLFEKVGHKLIGLDDGDIEHYHRIRNHLYHNGTGLGVDKRYLSGYRQIAAVLLNNLFGVEAIPTKKKSIMISEEATLEKLIILWNEVDKLVRKKISDAGIDTGHTYKWEMAMKENLFDMQDITQITELRMIRNSQVHSTANKIDKKKIELGIMIANELLGKFKSRVSYSD